MGKINFDTEDYTDLKENLVQVEQRYYLKKCWHYNAANMFGIPKEIELELDLKPKDNAYFCTTSVGTMLTFKTPPTGVPKSHIIKRKINIAGSSNTLFLRIPPKFKPFKVTQVRLINSKGYKPNEWLIQMFFTDST